MESNYIVFGAAIIGLIATFIPKEAYTYIWLLVSPKKKGDQNIVFDIPESANKVAIPLGPKTYEIHEIVEQWSTLKKMLKNENLDDAIKSLDDVFLKLLKKNEKSS